MPSIPKTKLIRQNLRAVKNLYPQATDMQLLFLREVSRTQQLSVTAGDMIMLDGRWHVTHSGLLRVAQRKRCSGIKTELQAGVSNPAEGYWVFKATVLRSRSASFVGYGDANPSNVSPLVHGAEMRVAETRAVNRALPQGLRHRHLLGRGDRFVCRTGFFLSGVEEAPAPARQRELWRLQGPRPPLPAHPRAPTRCHPRQVLRHRFLRH